jgi:hypothetical protein
MRHLPEVACEFELYDDVSEKAAEIRQHLEAGDYEGACAIASAELDRQITPIRAVRMRAVLVSRSSDATRH